MKPKKTSAKNTRRRSNTDPKHYITLDRSWLENLCAYVNYFLKVYDSTEWMRNTYSEADIVKFAQKEFTRKFPK